jgi:type II secretory pathway pseudopilin PulG
MLLVAAALKAHALWTDPSAMDSVPLPRWAYGGLSCLELVLGLWLVAGVSPAWARVVALVLFASFLRAAAVQTANGSASCACLGKLRVPPWLIVLVDLGVIGVIGVLLALLLPAVQSVRQATSRLSCSNNLRQIGLGCRHYHDTNGTLPPSLTFAHINGNTVILTWGVLLLPYIEQETLWRQTNTAFRTQPISCSQTVAYDPSTTRRNRSWCPWPLVPAGKRWTCPSESLYEKPLLTRSAWSLWKAWRIRSCVLSS